jgi:hypothetical protein
MAASYAGTGLKGAHRSVSNFRRFRRQGLGPLRQTAGLRQPRWRSRLPQTRRTSLGDLRLFQGAIEELRSGGVDTDPSLPQKESVYFIG